MELPKICQKAPYLIPVETGKKYAWCACGLSQKQPFCDGSHKDTGFAPIIYKAEADRTIAFCGCKHSKNGALCDGTHKDL